MYLERSVLYDGGNLLDIYRTSLQGTGEEGSDERAEPRLAGLNLYGPDEYHGVLLQAHLRFIKLMNQKE